MEWQTLTWDAVATIVTGVLAVGAALFVGLKQTEIMRNQQSDLLKQNNMNLFLQQQSLRNDLLDRRSDCISRMRPLWGEYMTNARLSGESLELLKKVLWDSQLFFSVEISKKIEEVIQSQLLADHRLETAHRYHELGDPVIAAKWQDKGFASEDKVFEAIWKLLDEMIAETRLSDRPA